MSSHGCNDGVASGMRKFARRMEDVDLKAVAARWESWWNGTLGRPLFALRFRDDFPRERRDFGAIPAFPANWTMEEIINAKMEGISNTFYCAEGFPLIWFDYGPGAVAPLFGGDWHCDGTWVWFGASPLPEEAIYNNGLKCDFDIPWWHNIRAMVGLAAERLGEHGVVGLPELGSELDTLSALRGAPELLMDLLDRPEEVETVLARINAVHLDALADLRTLGGTYNPASSWASPWEAVIVQCDFSYMIGPGDFAHFALPHIRERISANPHSIYHLDGKDALRHLPTLLAVEELNCIQWVPGDGAPPQSEWKEVLRTIEQAGKRLHLYGTCDQVRKSLECLNKPEAAYIFSWDLTIDSWKDWHNLMSDYGVAF